MKDVMGRRLKSACAVFLCLSMLTGFFVLAPETAKAFPDTATFMGVVRDNTSNPLPNSYIKVMLFVGNGQDVNWSMTDGFGEYSINVPGGFEYAVFVANSSYYMALQFAKIASGETKWVNFTLNPITEAQDVTIKGVVTDELGSPVSNGHVLAIVNDPVTGGDGPPYYANVTVPGADGSFEIRVIPGAMGGGSVAMDFPGYPMIDNTTDAPLVSGNTYWFNLTLQQTVYSDDAMVHGNVTDIDTGAPLEFAVVSIEIDRSMGERYSNFTVTNASGYYEMNVQNGSGRLTIQKIGYTTKIFDGFVVAEGADVQQDAALKQTLAKIRGNVTDSSTGDPLVFARVFLFDDQDMHENMSMATTNDTGFYELDAFVGNNLYLGAEQSGYSMNTTMVNVSSGDELWYDFGLVRLTAWLVGEVSNAMNGSPVSQIWMHFNSTAYETWSSPDVSGHYNVSLLPGNYTIEIYSWDYLPFVDNVTVVDAVENQFNISLIPVMSALLVGKVTDVLNGSPIAGANLQAHGMGYGNSTTTNSTGDYEMWVNGGQSSISCEVAGYETNYSTVDLPYMNTTFYNISLVPLSPPTTTRLNGTVTNMSSGAPINGAQVRIRLNVGSYENWTSTNSTGEYEMQVPAWVLDVRTTAYDHAPNFTEINVTGMADFQLDVQLGDDAYSPNLTYTQSPVANVSALNPTIISAQVEEDYLQWMSLVLLMEWNSSGLNSNYTVMTWRGMSLDPLNGYSNLNWTSAGNDYSINEVWNATADGGWLRNATKNGYFPASQSYWGSEPAWAIRGWYTNDTVTRLGGSVWFYESNGSYIGFWPSGAGPSLIPADDLSGVFEPVLTVAEFTEAGGDWPVAWGDQSLGEWNVSEALRFDYTPLVPSGKYKTEFIVFDWGGHGAGEFTNITVDNTPPVADPGPAQSVNNITLVTLDASASYDNVGIENYTWSFTDGSLIVLYGMQVQHTFASPGVYTVTLTVRDGGGNLDFAIVDVTVNGVPTANATYSPSTPLAGELVTLDGSSSIDDGTILYWNWSFSDGGIPVTLSGEIVTYSFMTPSQSVLVTLNVTDDSGNWDIYTFTIDVGAMIPEFPTLVLPVLSLMAIFAAVGMIGRRRRQ